MNVSIRVVGQELRLTAPFRPLVSGTQNFIKFKFLFFDKDWDELTTFAQIVQGDNAYNLYLDDDDSVILPPEITEGVCTIMLYGSGTTTPDNIDADNTIRATSNAIKLRIDENRLTEDASSIELTQTLYDQLLATMKKMVGHPFVASTVSEMTDTGKVYVYTGSETGYVNGNWYYYNGTAWTSGGVYNSAEGVSISQVTETDITLTTPSAVDYNVPRSESILTQVFDTVYPIGSTFRTETQNGYPQRGSWTLTEKELKNVARMYTVNGSVKLKVQGITIKSALVIKFLATLPTSVSGAYDGTVFVLGSMPTSAMGVNNFTGLVKEYIEGTISNTDSDVAVPALFSVSSGERSTLTLESWEGSLPESGNNNCMFTLTIPFASISESSTSLPIIYIYKRNG